MDNNWLILITNRLLSCFKEHGYNKVYINKDFVIVEQAIRDEKNRPVIWNIVEKLGLGFGCGSTYRYQYERGRLIQGDYYLKGKKWNREMNRKYKWEDDFRRW